LFQYLDDNGHALRITSTDVNAYLRDLTGRDVTAKDFRTWAGTVLAASLLHAAERPKSATASKRQVREALREVAARLGNTIEICRKCYVHPEVLSAYLAGELRLRRSGADSADEWRPEEAATLRFLQRRIRQANSLSLRP
jgi:DNA topoisomerase-1